LVTPDYKIPLSHISRLERVDSKPYCLLLETKDRRYHLSFKNDEELYDWQDDVYLRSPLGEGKPFGFVHNIHVGTDPASGTFLVSPNGLSCAYTDSSTSTQGSPEPSTTMERSSNVAAPQRTRHARLLHPRRHKVRRQTPFTDKSAQRCPNALLQPSRESPPPCQRHHQRTSRLAYRPGWTSLRQGGGWFPERMAVEASLARPWSSDIDHL